VVGACIAATRFKVRGGRSETRRAPTLLDHPHSPASHNSETTPATGTAINIATPQNRAAKESLLEGLMIPSVHRPPQTTAVP